MYFETYQDNIGEWRWRLKVENGRTIADSGEGYVAKADCLHGIALVKASKDAEIRDGQGVNLATLGILGRKR